MLTHRTNFRSLAKLPLIVRDLQEKTRALERSKVAFQKMMFDVNHVHLKPYIASIKGCLLMVKRDNHYRYAELGLLEVDKLEEKVDEMFKKYESFQ
jgi:hypothetical protein